MIRKNNAMTAKTRIRTANITTAIVSSTSSTIVQLVIHFIQLFTGYRYLPTRPLHAPPVAVALGKMAVTSSSFTLSILKYTQELNKTNHITEDTLNRLRREFMTAPTFLSYILRMRHKYVFYI